MALTLQRKTFLFKSRFGNSLIGTKMETVAQYESNIRPQTNQKQPFWPLPHHSTQICNIDGFKKHHRSPHLSMHGDRQLQKAKKDPAGAYETPTPGFSLRWATVVLLNTTPADPPNHNLKLKCLHVWMPTMSTHLVVYVAKFHWVYILHSWAAVFNIPSILLLYATEKIKIFPKQGTAVTVEHAKPNIWAKVLHSPQTPANPTPTPTQLPQPMKAHCVRPTPATSTPTMYQCINTN